MSICRGLSQVIAGVYWDPVIRGSIGVYSASIGGLAGPAGGLPKPGPGRLAGRGAAGVPKSVNFS